MTMSKLEEDAELANAEKQQARLPPERENMCHCGGHGSLRVAHCLVGAVASLRHVSQRLSASRGTTPTGFPWETCLTLHPC
jgi:hypothetical protein